MQQRVQLNNCNTNIFFQQKRADQLSMHVQTYIQDQESSRKIVHHEKLKQK
jgi:hypothetical protein